MAFSTRTSEMPLTVAIASEFDPFDGEIYRFLLSALLGTDVVKWTGGFIFNGCRSVAKFAPAFLPAAGAGGVRHALLAVDNDGGSRRRPEHQVDHVSRPFDLDDDEGCRECWLEKATPSSWSGKTCIGVPVQTIETWLLVLRGHSFERAPEHLYARRVLRKLFFGEPHPPVADRIKLALSELTKPDALQILAARPSFQRFAKQLEGWP
jgi:hypothetical protein